MNLNERTLQQLPKRAVKPAPVSAPAPDISVAMAGIELQQRVLADTMATIAKMMADRRPVKYVVERDEKNKIKCVIARPA